MKGNIYCALSKNCSADATSFYLFKPLVEQHNELWNKTTLFCKLTQNKTGGL